MVFVAGGTVLVQAVLQLLIAFHVPVTEQQTAAITTLTTIIFGLLARQHVTPMSSLPPGVAGEIAEKRAEKAAEVVKRDEAQKP